jgi:hypothetical protein
MVVQDGYYKFKGMHHGQVSGKRYGDELETYSATYVKLDDMVVVFEEDPKDGYRSYCNTYIATELPKGVVFNLESYPVPCYVKNLETNDPHVYESFRGLGIFTDESCQVMLAKYGTDNQDDYYPRCVTWLDLPAINRHLAEHHLIGD